jgi:hypothetical protein
LCLLVWPASGFPLAGIQRQAKAAGMGGSSDNPCHAFNCGRLAVFPIKKPQARQNRSTVRVYATS